MSQRAGHIKRGGQKEKHYDAWQTFPWKLKREEQKDTELAKFSHLPSNRAAEDSETHYGYQNGLHDGKSVLVWWKQKS